MNRIEQRGQGGVQYNAQTREMSGYGVVFNTDSVPLHLRMTGGTYMAVTERIDPQAFADADMEDVIATYNHEGLFARTSSGTMNLSIDPAGVKYRFEVPETTAGNDLAVMVQRGDVRGSSFGFLIDPDNYEIEERDENTIVATAMKIEKVIDIGPVDNPAYKATESRGAAMIAALEKYFHRKEETESAHHAALAAEWDELDYTLALTEAELNTKA